ncbi:conserved hypothetical protein [Frankia canadensis]|uniref:Peptide chain release factor 1 n=1 Tax=Frankia canadensis TaxID=1836972 RepID=A0A2I2KM55_9ACTN|nr:Vms1/Ankzf1 family peptidyl-tRNA hydrolase [Frankia canadensis]SNQ46748.1 conserved hypothetical protein [Frankia canadensis]SOU54038.1 conserved hypothetical protein [Frankia canadensis]
MDLKELRTAYSDDGQVVTVYLGAHSGQPNAYQQLEARWDDTLTRLAHADLGVDAATVKALRRARGGHPEGGTRMLVAAGGAVRYERHLPDPIDTDIVRVGALPYLLPLVAWGQSRVPHVLALVDRLGVDVLAYRDDPAAGEEPVVTGIEATPHPWHKTGRGGWSAARYQHRVEEDWRIGARAAAELLEKTAAGLGAWMIVMAGDPKAVALVRGQLPASLDARTRVVSGGGRADDGSAEVIAAQVADLLRDQSRRDVAGVLAEFDQRRRRRAALAGAAAPTGSAASAEGATRPDELGAVPAASIVLDGPAETVAGLAEARVATLLLSDDLEEDAPISFGPRPTDLALRPDDLPALGERARQGALVDVLLRAAIGTDADILIVPASTPESPAAGVGALPRYVP